jgi:polyisoprenoid-binding protein YceI
MRAALLSSMLAGWVGAAHGAPTTYTLDPAGSELTVQVFKDNSALSALAHDHVIAARGWTGSATIDVDESGAVQGCAVTVSVPVRQLQPDIPALRAALGWTVMLTDAQQAQVKEHMVGADQLDGGNHATIAFTAEDCSGTVDAMVVNGSMTVHGQVKAVGFTFVGAIAQGQLSGTGGFSITHADFGFEPYNAFLGTLRNKEQMTVSIRIAGTAQ